MGEGLVHVHVAVEAVEEDGCVLVGHQVADEPFFAQAIHGLELLNFFVVLDDLRSTLLIVKRVEDLVQPRVPLLLIQEVNQLRNINVVGISLSSVKRRQPYRKCQ